MKLIRKFCEWEDACDIPIWAHGLHWNLCVHALADGFRPADFAIYADWDMVLTHRRSKNRLTQRCGYSCDEPHLRQDARLCEWRVTAALLIACDLAVLHDDSQLAPLSSNVGAASCLW